MSSNKLSIGIVGLPNVGKSTLFNLLTKQGVLAANYPFATIDPNVGIVPVPDERLDKLAELSKSKKKISAVVEFYDIAGLVQGANRGEGLGNQFLSHIRETEVLVVVLRAFAGDEVVHVENSVDPVRDLEIIKTELVLKDIETVEKRLHKLESEAKSGDLVAKKNLGILHQVHAELVKDNPATSFRGEDVVDELQLLTAKRVLYLVNGKPEDVSEKLKEHIAGLGADYLVLNLAEANNLTPLITKTYEILDLVSFLTTGEDETRAWTILQNMKAPQAAGVIHTDFEKKFIRAEVVNWQKLLDAGSWANARQKGLLRLEGKEYVVEDGDVLVIRHG